MEIIAKTNNLRMSARKVRLVVDAVKKKPLPEILVNLKFIEKGAAKPILKLFNSAVSNAKHNFGVEIDNLILKRIEVGEGPTYKRFRAVSRGRAHHILKRTANIIVVLEETKGKAKPKKAVIKPNLDQMSEVKTETRKDEFPFKEKEILSERKIKEEKPISRKPVLTRRIPQGKGK